MKHLTTPQQMVSLSPNAKKKLDEWLQEKDYGMYVPNNVFIPISQLTMSQLTEFLIDQELINIAFEEWLQRKNENEDIMDILWKHAAKILEEKN